VWQGLLAALEKEKEGEKHNKQTNERSQHALLVHGSSLSDTNNYSRCCHPQHLGSSAVGNYSERHHIFFTVYFVCSRPTSDIFTSACILRTHIRCRHYFVYSAPTAIDLKVSWSAMPSTEWWYCPSGTASAISRKRSEPPLPKKMV